MKWFLALLVLVSSIALVSVAYPLYWVTHIANDAELLWNDAEAHLFVRSSRLGYRRNLLQFVADRMSARFGIVPTEARRDLVLVKFTGEGFERNSLTDTRIAALTVFNNRVYTNVNGTFVRLVGTNFEIVPLEEQREFESSAALLSKDGWSWRSNVLTRESGESRFRLDVGGQRWTVVAHNNRRYPDGWTAIDLQKGDETPQRVWYLDVRPRYTSKAEYSAFLSQ